MVELVTKTLAGQMEAALAMMNECIEKCPSEHWDGKIAKYPFWMVAYHTLCFLDLYLTPAERDYAPRPDLHPKGWAEFDEEYPSRRFDKSEITAYVAICRRKIVEVIGAETRESLEGPSGHARRKFPRIEMHLYNLRHVQHHTGQLSAFLRRAGVDTGWASTGWT